MSEVKYYILSVKYLTDCIQIGRHLSKFLSKINKNPLLNKDNFILQQEYFYICVGVAVFIAAGGTLINHYSHCGGYCNDYNKGMALACCMLAAGATMAIDLGLMVFNCRR